tara:strand:- start:153 stop:521 length:369 start_codon:yes stop_codon:yes gene_type:complete
MTKLELEVKIEALQKLLGEKVTEQTTYQSQINDLQKQLDDLNKPKLTAKQFDEVSEAIETAIGNFDFSNEDNYSIEFGLDYDSRVHCESFQFDNAYDLHREIYDAVDRLFAEVEDDNQENQD